MIAPDGPLCEACGYSLAGLSTGDLCPECRQGIWKSISARRFGSAWQRAGGRGAWFATAADFLLHPRQEFRKVLVERRRSLVLLTVSLAIAAVLGSTPWMVAIAMGELEPWPDRNWWPGLAFGLRTMATLAVVIALLWLAMASVAGALGVLVRMLGRERGWRITWDVAITVCGHAAVGWVVGSLVAMLASAITLAVWLAVDRGAAGADLVFAGWWAGAALGFAWFTVLATMGVSACRFANPHEYAGSWT